MKIISKKYTTLYCLDGIFIYFINYNECKEYQQKYYDKNNNFLPIITYKFLGIPNNIINWQATKNNDYRPIYYDKYEICKQIKEE